MTAAAGGATGPSGTSLGGAVNSAATLDGSGTSSGGGGGGGGLRSACGLRFGGGGGAGATGKGLGGAAINSMSTTRVTSCAGRVMPACELSQSSASTCNSTITTIKTTVRRRGGEKKGAGVMAASVTPLTLILPQSATLQISFYVRKCR